MGFEGTQYTQQSYKVSDSFPFKWINKKWREGFHVTSMATAGSRWGVVMSRNSGYSEQVRLQWCFFIWWVSSSSFSFWFVVLISNSVNLLHCLLIPLSLSLFTGCGTWFSISEWRHPQALGWRIQNHINSSNNRSSCSNSKYPTA